MTEKTVSEDTINLMVKHKITILDKNNILWKVVDGKVIGKRSVYTFDLRSVWLEDCKLEEIKSWWCGKDADYNEIFNHDQSK